MFIKTHSKKHAGGKAKLWCRTSATLPPHASVSAVGVYCKCVQQSTPEGSRTLFPSSLLVQRHSWWGAHSVEQSGRPCLPSAAASPGSGNYSSCLSRSTASCMQTQRSGQLAQEEHEIALPPIGHWMAPQLLMNPCAAHLTQAVQQQSIANRCFCCHTHYS